MLLSSVFRRSTLAASTAVTATAATAPSCAAAAAAAARHAVSRRTMASASSNELMKTSLNEWHKELGGDMVPFAGYELPVLYKNQSDNCGVMKEHLWCRSEGKASLFDVSHMGQIRWHGKDRTQFVERIVGGDIQGLKENQSCLSLITNAEGGIMDDTVITNAGDHIYMVVNGATKFTDMAHFSKILVDEFADKDVTMEYLQDDYQLLAVQGSGAAAAILKVMPNNSIHSRNASEDKLHIMPFMSSINNVMLDGIYPCRLTRCGYTGEDGFEISVPAGISTIQLASKLIKDPTVNPTGLGARDSLRLEAGLCLYGNDLNDTINPVMGGLSWTLGKPNSRRRLEQGYLGADTFLTPEGKLQKQQQKRVGIIGMKAPARQDTEIYDATGTTKIGVITSGTYSPCLKKPIAMGYVDTAHSKADTDIQLNIRNKMVSAKVTKMPFVESRYYRVPE